MVRVNPERAAEVKEEDIVGFFPASGQENKPPAYQRTGGIAVAIIIVALAYIGSAKLGFTVAFAAEQVTLVWPPSGIALAALLLAGMRAWPGIFIGAFIANVTTNEPALTALGIAAGNTLEALVGALLLRRAGFQNSLDRLRDVFALILYSALLSTMVSATIGTFSLCATGLQPWHAYLPLWRIWWLGDAGGALLVAPAILVWGRRFQQKLPAPSTRRIVEACTLVCGLIFACAVIFMRADAGGLSGYSLIYIVFPFIIWAALRFGQRATTIVTLIASGIAVWSTAHTLGPFGAQSIGQSLLLLEIFMATVAATGLLLSAAISERKSAEAKLIAYTGELEHINRQLDDFVHIASHDLKEPLRGLILQASFLLDDLGEEVNDDARKRLRRMIDLGQHMGHLVDDLLHFSRLSREKSSQQEINPEAIIERIRSMAESWLAERNARIAVVAPLPRLKGDGTAMTEVFRNLITNAVKYNDKDEPVVEVGFLQHLHSPGGVVNAVFYVRDNGIGIDPQYHDEIFHIFRRLPDAVRYDQSGTGAGLTFVKKIIERHDGRIWLESAPGKGSVFYFTFPCAGQGGQKDG